MVVVVAAAGAVEAGLAITLAAVEEDEVAGDAAAVEPVARPADVAEESLEVAARAVATCPKPFAAAFSPLESARLGRPAGTSTA